MDENLSDNSSRTRSHRSASFSRARRRAMRSVGRPSAVAATSATWRRTTRQCDPTTRRRTASSRLILRRMIKSRTSAGQRNSRRRSIKLLLLMSSIGIASTRPPRSKRHTRPQESRARAATTSKSSGKRPARSTRATDLCKTSNRYCNRR